MHDIGYACMHAGTHAKQTGVSHRLTTGRTCRAATRATSLDVVGNKALENIQDLHRILLFNVAHKIKCFRVSALFPWLDTYDPFTLPQWNEIAKEIDKCKVVIAENDLRITTHPGQYVCLASPNTVTVERSISELNAHGLMFDLLGLPRTPWAKINIHIGGTYCKPKMSDDECQAALIETSKRFVKSFARLDRSVQLRMTLENDDKINGWSVQRLHEHVLPRIHDTLGVSVPIVFDSLHWEHGPRTSEIDRDYSNALLVAVNTWGDVTPMVHHSQSAHTENLSHAEKIRVTAHSKRYTMPFNNPNNHKVHVMLECKDKELGAIDYLKRFT